MVRLHLLGLALCAVAVTGEAPPAATLAADVSKINLPEWLSRSNKPVPAATNLAQGGVLDVTVPDSLPPAPGPMDPSKVKLSVAGKVFLALLGLFFAVELICYVCKNLLAKPLDEAYFAKARAALVLVPVFSVLILFVMFRAKKQGVDQPVATGDSEAIVIAKGLYPTMQMMYVIGMIGIYVQVLDAIDISILSNTLGNVSQKFGPLCVTVGFFGCVYGALYVRDTSIQLSTSAECISYLAAVFLIIQLGITFQSYKSEIPGMDKLPKTGDDDEINKKLASALVCCKYVPHAMIIFWFWYLLAEYAGFELQTWAQNCMYLAVWGIVLQAVGVFGGQLGKFLRMLGLLLMFIGLCALIYTAFVLHQIGLGPYTNLLTATALNLVGAVIIFQALVVIGTECSDSAISAERIAIFNNIIKVLDYATVLAVLMLYIHFRALMIGAVLPEVVTYAAQAVGGALLFMCLLMAINLPAAGALLLAALYIGFAVLVMSATMMKPGETVLPDEVIPDFENPEPLVLYLFLGLGTLTYIGAVVGRMSGEAVPEVDLEPAPAKDEEAAPAATPEAPAAAE